MKSCNIGSHMSGNKLLAGQKNRNRLIAIIVSVVNIAAMGILFDFYYDLNDDKVICEILSGRYSGMPSGHNMQMLYPLSELIALCYRVQRFIPWYGLFLLMCQFGCFYLVSVRLLSFCQTGKGKAFTLIILCFFQWWVCLAVFGQYNIYGYLWDDVCNCDFSFYDNSERVRYKTVSVTKYSSYNLGDYSLSDSHRDASPLISLYLLGRFLLHDC